MKVDVITPIGPGHESEEIRIRENVKSVNKGVFDSVGHIIVDDSNGSLGRSKARNIGVSKSQADWLFFLDADDSLLKTAFEDLDFLDYDAVFGLIAEADGDGYTIRENQPETLKNFSQFIEIDPFLSVQIGHFVKRKIAKETPFNEAISCGEDFDYYLRLWKNNHVCKIDKVFFVNSRSNPAQNSKQGNIWRQIVLDMMTGAGGMFLTEKKRLQNIQASFDRFPHMEAARLHDGRWNICAGGPSLRKEISKIRKAKGVIVSVNGTHDYLLSKKIKPDYFILTDPREHNVRFVRKARKGTTYLISADCDPKVFDALEGYDVQIWFPLDYELPVPVSIGGGTTVGLRAINIGYTLGYDNIHLWGFDGCVKEHHHAYPQPENDDEPTKVINYEGKDYTMTNWQVIQADNFDEMMRKYHLNITVHTQGVIKHIGEYNASRRRTAPDLRSVLHPLDATG